MLTSKAKSSWLLVLVLWMSPVIKSYCADPVILGDKVKVSFSGLVLNRLTNTYDTLASLTNTSTDTIKAPVSLIITGINPGSVSLANAGGQTADGKPFVNVAVPGSGLLPGASISKIPLKFSNPLRVRFTFTHAVTGVIDAPVVDIDQDGYSVSQGDCNDSDPNINPGKQELCNNIDDNCSGIADEGFDAGASCSAGTGVCANSGVKICTDDGAGTVCNASAGTPGAETCNGLDDDCDAEVDENLGNLSCGVGACLRTVSACENGSPQSCVPGTPTPEVCGNGIDEDCSGADLTCPGGEDTQPPSLSINSPADGTFILVKRPVIDVSYSDPSGVNTQQLAFALNGNPLDVDCTVTDTMAHCTPQTDFPDGANTLRASVPDNNNITANAESRFTVDSAALAIKITSPANALITKEGEIVVTGTVDSDVESVKVNEVVATVSQGSFNARVPLREGTNMIVAVGTKASGKTGTDSIDVTYDIFAPIVRIDSPADGFVSPNDRVPVTGLVNDIVSGNTKAVVKVNGIEATVSDGTFMVPEVPLVRGPNTIEVVATDSVGNTGRHSINVTFEQPVGARLSIQSGNGQADVVNRELSEKLVAVVKDDLGNPVAGRVVNFEVTRNSGMLKAIPTDTPKRLLQVPTDGSGRAMVIFKLGDTAGEGNNRVTATAVGVTGAIEFCASGLALPAQKILMTMGDNQRGVIGNPLATPLEALVVDQAGNPIKDFDVTYTVVKGTGNFDGQATKVVKTAVDGTVRAVFTLGAEPGINNNVVSATFPGLPGAAATFVASGLAPGNPANTKFSGVVLDNGHTPIPGAVVKIDGTSVSDVTDEQGQFLLENVPVGHIHLLIDPKDSPRAETFPPLAFETVTIAGQTNILGQPILLPALDTEGSKIVGGNQDVTLKMKGVAGLELTIFKNSVTCPPGAPDRSADGKQCRISINQVHLDKVPMPPPSGIIFTPPAWSVQPHGVAFNPPARISIPNNGLPPGQIIDIFQFDHTLNEFINVGKGTVSKDAAVIVSDSGFGITRAGWGGGGPPPPPQTCVSSCDDKSVCTQDKCENGACVHTPVSDGTKCDDGSSCSIAICQGGACISQSSKPNGASCDDQKFCTENDQCKGGGCEGTNKPDRTGPSGSVAVNLDKAFDPVKGFLRTVFGSGAPDFSLQIAGNVGTVTQCCEKNQNDAVNKSGQGAATAGISGDFPIPGFSLQLPFNLGKAGLFATLGLSASATLGAQEDNCEDVVKGNVSGQVQASGTIKGQVTLPAEVASAAIGGSTGLTGGIAGTVSKGKIDVNFTGQHNGLVASATVQLVNGLIEATGSVVIIEPSGFAPVLVTVPFTL